MTSLLDLAMAADPAAAYDRLRANQGPVARVDLEPGVEAWLVMGHRELLTVTRSEHLYSRDARHWRLLQDGTVTPDSPLIPMMGYRENVTGADGAKHRGLRRPIEDALGGVDQRALRLGVEAICRTLITGFASRGQADLVGDYAVIVPMLALADLCGLDVAQGHQMLAAMQLLVGSLGEAQEGNRRFEQLIGAAIDSRRRCPARDVTTALIAHPGLTGHVEVLQTIVALVAAGYHTLIGWIAQTLRLLLVDDRFANRLHGGRLSIGDALDTVLWEDPPVAHFPGRYALTDTELGGQRIRRGDALILGLAAAATDPRISAGIEVGNRAHLAWSAGPHSCPAKTPARIIAQTAVDTVLELLPGVRLTVSAEDVPLMPAPWARCPAALPVAFPMPAA
ncbi:cytochrome P450 [Actinocorallia libanotica]|uniref:Cytochrome P450 n=1 Tax=Actinocorallia libanotica TaxID=46162 RepID=A0ABP4BZ17_9ACTN